MGNTNQSNEEQQQVEMSLKELLQAIEENRKKALDQVMKIEGEKDLNVEL